jgi:hypothetical protein
VRPLDELELLSDVPLEVDEIAELERAFERPSAERPAGRGPRRPRGPDLATKMLEAKRRRTKKSSPSGKPSKGRASSGSGSWAPSAKSTRKKPARASAKVTRGERGKSPDERSKSPGERGRSAKGPKKSKRRR